MSTEPAISCDVRPSGPIGWYGSDCISCYLSVRGAERRAGNRRKRFTCSTKCLLSVSKTSTTIHLNISRSPTWSVVFTFDNRTITNSTNFLNISNIKVLFEEYKFCIWGGGPNVIISVLILTLIIHKWGILNLTVPRVSKCEI